MPRFLMFRLNVNTAFNFVTRWYSAQKGVHFQTTNQIKITLHSHFKDIVVRNLFISEATFSLSKCFTPKLTETVSASFHRQDTWRHLYFEWRRVEWNGNFIKLFSIQTGADWKLFHLIVNSVFFNVRKTDLFKTLFPLIVNATTSISMKTAV